jgi:hypothetical protein
VDGFDQDEGAGKGDESREVLRCFLAAQGDPLEAFELADSLLDPGAAFVEDTGKESGACGSVFSVWDGWADAAAACSVTIGLGVVSFIAENGARRDVGADVEVRRTPLGLPIPKRTL